MDTSVILYDQSEKKGICILHPAMINMKYRRRGKEMQVLPDQVKGPVKNTLADLWESMSRLR